MRESYPVVITKSDGQYTVDIPDFSIGTQGSSVSNAIYMARDAIGLVGIDMEDDGETLPSPSSVDAIPREDGAIVTLVDIDFTEYRRAHDQRAVRKNCTLPAYLSAAAEKAGLNFSALLQSAIKRELRLGDG